MVGVSVEHTSRASGAMKGIVYYAAVSMSRLEGKNGSCKFSPVL